MRTCDWVSLSSVSDLVSRSFNSAAVTTRFAPFPGAAAGGFAEVLLAGVVERPGPAVLLLVVLSRRAAEVVVGAVPTSLLATLLEAVLEVAVTGGRTPLPVGFLAGEELVADGGREVVDGVLDRRREAAVLPVALEAEDVTGGRAVEAEGRGAGRTVEVPVAPRAAAVPTLGRGAVLVVLALDAEVLADVAVGGRPAAVVLTRPAGTLATLGRPLFAVVADGLVDVAPGYHGRYSKHVFST